MVWPSYWARLRENKVTPLLPEQVTKTGKLPRPSSEDALRDPYFSKPLADAEIKQVLDALATDGAAGEPVFIASGKMYRVAGGILKAETNEAAKPYSWPLAHDVRPAREALGAKSCAECHGADSPIYFGQIAAHGPVDATNSLRKAMWEFRNDDQRAASTFAFTFNFRPTLKIICFSAALLIFAILASFGLSGVGALARKLSGRPPANGKDPR